MEWIIKTNERKWADRLSSAREVEDWEIVSGIEAEIRESLFGQSHVEILLDADNLGGDGQRHINTVAVFIPAYLREAEIVVERGNWFIRNRFVRKAEITPNGNVDYFIKKV